MAILFKRFFFHPVSIIGLSMLMTACMVGPNFHSPKAPEVSRYNETPLPAHTASTPSAGKAGKAQTYSYRSDIPEQWWQLFRSPEINDLVTLGIRNNPSMTSAQAALRQAQEILYAQIGNSLYPAFDLNASGKRQRFVGGTFGSSGIPSSIFNTVTASVNVSYTLDIFGGARREIESLQAQVDYQQFELIATYLSLTTNIVTTAVNIASLQDQILATQALIKAEEGQLNIIKQQYRLGGVASTNVLTQQTQVDQTRATLPPLEKSLSQSRHALSVLIGQFPNEPLPPLHLTKLTLPVKIPVSLPSHLVRQRPDVRAAEALIHSASAQIGVATANLFPQFTITGSYGWTSAAPSSLFNPANKLWNIAGTLLQPVFHGGALLAQRRAAIAAYNQAAAQYRQTLLQAFQNVADTLRALETDARTFREQKFAEISARDTFLVTAQQYKLGGVNYINLLNAEQQYQQTRISSIQAQAARYADTAALFQALGGGWWNRDATTCDAVNPTRATLTCP